MRKTTIISLSIYAFITIIFFGCGQSKSRKSNKHNNIEQDRQKININQIEFDVNANYEFFTWQNLPEDLKYERNEIVSFTNTNGDKHFYELIYLPDGNLNWYQAAYLADNAGGYLACVTSVEENTFLFNMVNDEKYFWKFPKYIRGRGKANHHEIMIGPMLGGFKHDASVKPIEGWQWLSGEKWEYTNWAQNLDDGIIDKDPRDNTQPNNSGEHHSQRTIGFGELNQPVPTWGDYSDDSGTYRMERSGGKRYAFIIEYNEKPEL